jgi:uncharacterized NAD(P)/FAD-binding protein YdhS
MIHLAARHAIIVGGGASGVMLAYQLLKNREPGLRVTLIERQPEIGRGSAYHTHNPEHLLNVRAANMSALPDDPEHFWRWLTNRPGGAPCPDSYCFVPRRIYGDYLASLVEPLTADADASSGLTILHAQCTEIDESPSGVTVTLADGACLIGDAAVLATGNDGAASRLALHTDPWAASSTIDRNATVLILGTGLTMVDYVLSLLRDGHRGPIIAMSRRGLLAKAHRRTHPMKIDEADVPFGASATQLLRWLRRQIATHMADGGDWRSVIDAIRPFTQRLWQELPTSSKRRFLEHARAWWDVHRHRMAPEVEMRITQALAAGRLLMLPAKIAAIDPNEAGALVHYRRRGQRQLAGLQVGVIVDCTGIVKDPLASSNPLIQDLVEKGQARADTLKIGIDVAEDCAVVGRRGVASRRLFAVGPLTRSAFWEIVAVPDIRKQCADLAARLLTVLKESAPSRDKTAFATTVLAVQPQFAIAQPFPGPAESLLPQSDASPPRTAGTAA